MRRLRQFPIQDSSYCVCRTIAIWDFTPAQISEKYGFHFENGVDDFMPLEGVMIFDPLSNITFGLRRYSGTSSQGTEILINIYADPPQHALDLVIDCLEISRNDLQILDTENALPDFVDQPHDLPISIPYAWYWKAASTVGFAKTDDWQQWAKQLLDKRINPPQWLHELALVNTHRELAGITLTRRENELGRIPEGSTEHLDSLFGYLSLLRNKKANSPIQFLNDAITAAEIYSCSLQPESINRILEGWKKTKSFMHTEMEIQELFLPYEEVAVKQWGILQTASNVYHSAGYRPLEDWGDEQSEMDLT